MDILLSDLYKKKMPMDIINKIQEYRNNKLLKKIYIKVDKKLKEIIKKWDFDYDSDNYILSSTKKEYKLYYYYKIYNNENNKKITIKKLESIEINKNCCEIYEPEHHDYLILIKEILEDESHKYYIKMKNFIGEDLDYYMKWSIYYFDNFNKESLSQSNQKRIKENLERYILEDIRYIF